MILMRTAGCAYMLVGKESTEATIINLLLGAKQRRGTSLRLCRFFLAIPWRRIGFERAEKMGRDAGHFVDRGQEHGFVCL